MQIRNNTLITECSAYDFKEMLERKKVKSWLKSVSAFANTEASSFFTTFYNLNWGKNERIPVEEVAERVNSPLKKYPANEESSVEKFGVNAKMFGVNSKSSVKKFGVNADKFGNTSETPKKVSKTAQKIIDLVISDPSITADNMANKVGVTKRAIEKNIKNLRGMGILVHEGSDKAGYWRIVINPQTEL